MATPFFDAIIFDHDGTLVDTELPDFLAWEMLYQEHGATITIEHWAAVAVGHMNGLDQLFTELIAQGGPHLTPPTLRQRLEQLWPLTLDSVGLMPGVEPLLVHLQAAGYPLAIATASDRSWVTRWLTRFQLQPYFKAIATSNDVPNGKPAPDVYLLAARQLGVAPQRCLVFEDSLAGLQAAKAAGMVVVAVPSPATQSLDFSQADHIIPSLEHATAAWLAALGAKDAKLF
jgi:HAD superfamily hydrolase (TIGR01509 family)